MSAAVRDWSDDERSAEDGAPEPIRRVWALRPAWPATGEVSDAEELVSVVVPARNEENAIGACLDSILAQDWTAIEVLVVDGDSTDRTPDIVAEYADRDPRVRLLHNPRRIIPVSLNVALAEARSRWLVRVDAHAEVPPEYVRLAVAHLRTGRYGGVGGRKDGVGHTPAGRAVAAAMASRFGVGGSTYHWGEEVADVEHVPFGAYPVDLLRSMGGWDEELVVNQDFELDYRLRAAGHRILFDPAMRIDWECRQSIGALYKQYRRYGGGKVMVALKHPASLRPRHLAAPALVLMLGAAAAVSLRRPAAGAALAAPYVLGLGVATAQTAKQVDPKARRYVAPAFVAMHVGWGVGFWQRVAQVARQRLRGR
ncbi:MAG TPA: glycosyltransferase family 2 protein [Actinomycetes bacterium]|nr:glycosyltransferase family 2 protein [Actinomycetes bacterium]